LSTDWQKYYKYFQNQSASAAFNEIHIQRVRFKPGYLRIWKNARNDLKLSYNLTFKYQSRLTKFLLYFNKFIIYKVFLQNQFQLSNILLKSRLFPTKTYILIFLQNQWVFVNGIPSANPTLQLIVCDFIQLIVSIRYYIIYRWLLNWAIKQKLRLRVRIKRLVNTYFLPDDKNRSSHFPQWIYSSKNINNDVSKYLEVDFFSLSIIVIYEPFLFNEMDFYDIHELKINIVNLYNWKYIT